MKRRLIGMAIAAAFSAQADIYRCTTNGHTTFSNMPCEGEKEEVYYKDTEYDIQRREKEKQEVESQKALAAQRAKIERDAQNVLGLIDAGRLDEARSYADQTNLDFDKILAIYQENLKEQQRIEQQRQQQEIERQRRQIATQRHELEEQQRRARQRSLTSPNSFTSAPTAPQGLIDPFSGTYMPRSGAGYVDPRNGTYYTDVGGGVVNTRIGQFTPTH